MRLIFIKTGATIMLLLLIPIVLVAQTNKHSNFFLNDQVRFTITPLLYDNLTINYWGEKLLKSSPTFSGEATILYHKSIKNNIGINIGAGLGLVPYNIHYYYETHGNTIFPQNILSLKHNDYVQFIWTFPLSVQKTIKYKQDKKYNIEVGIKINNVIAFPYEIEVEDWYELDDVAEARLFNFGLYETQKLIISYFVKFGIVKTLKKNNIFQINTILNISFTKIGIGYYKFENLPFESRGQVSQNINYLGIEFVYGLSLFKCNRTKGK